MADDAKHEPGKTIVWNGYTVPASCTTEVLALARLNAHERDKHIIFDDEPHTYYIKGVANYTSCTTFIHHHFEEFDKEGVASRMLRRADFATAPKYAKYQPLCFDQDCGKRLPDAEIVAAIIKSWDDNGALQSSLGTAMHRNIELFYNGEPHDASTPEFAHFLKYHETVTKNRNWGPLRTEMIVWDEDSRLCGSVDMIYVEKDRLQEVLRWQTEGSPPLHVHLVDWKRSKQISKHGYGKVGRRECAHLPDCNYYHYQLQLNLYKYMLEKNYNVVVDSLAILVCHPDNTTYLEFAVDDFQNTIQAMVQSHTRSLAES
jgi:hypothetical protein